ncbi:hypothetical protein ACIOEX_01405 [Streptomyces sp. NPDC087850]|uniref:hypothetical protein n=1 Tax=Streptomyces sp. NPDC087850 TaxID=3365809 RepID=UPI00381CF1E3
MSSDPWTIESIRDALADPALAQRFLSEINRAPAHELLPVFAKWESIAKDTLAAVERGRTLAVFDARGEEPPGDWTDRTDRVLADADRIRARGAA